MGLVSLTVMVQVVADGAVSEADGVKPEKKPPSTGWHGLSKDDDVTE